MIPFQKKRVVWVRSENWIEHPSALFGIQQHPNLMASIWDTGKLEGRGGRWSVGSGAVAIKHTSSRSFNADFKILEKLPSFLVLVDGSMQKERSAIAGVVHHGVTSGQRLGCPGMAGKAPGFRYDPIEFLR